MLLTVSLSKAVACIVVPMTDSYRMLISKRALRVIVAEEAKRIKEAGIPINRARELYGDDDARAPRGRASRKKGRSSESDSEAQAFADQLHAFFQSVKWGQDFAEDQSIEVFNSIEAFQSMEVDELVKHLMKQPPVLGALEQFLTYFVQAASEAEGE